MLERMKREKEEDGEKTANWLSCCEGSKVYAFILMSKLLITVKDVARVDENVCVCVCLIEDKEKDDF